MASDSPGVQFGGQRADERTIRDFHDFNPNGQIRVLTQQFNINRPRDDNPFEEFPKDIHPADVEQGGDGRSARNDDHLASGSQCREILFQFLGAVVKRHLPGRQLLHENALG